MKTFVFIACVLAIVRATEAITGKEFRNDLAECQKESNDSSVPMELNPTTVLCTFKKIGTLDDKSPIDKNKFYSLCESLISDPAKTKQCKDIINTCFNKVSQGGTTDMAQKLKFVTCGVKDNKVIGLIDS